MSTHTSIISIDCGRAVVNKLPDEEYSLMLDVAIISAQWEDAEITSVEAAIKIVDLFKDYEVK